MSVANLSSSVKCPWLIVLLIRYVKGLMYTSDTLFIIDVGNLSYSDAEFLIFLIIVLISDSLTSEIVIILGLL